MKSSIVCALMVALVALTSCQSSRQQQEGQSTTQAAKSETKPTQTETGREAFQRLFVTARGWAPDAAPYRLQSEPTPDATGQGGKSAVWRASFASPSRGAMRMFTWSGSQAEGAPQEGINPGPEDNTYSPTNRATAVFDVNLLKIDSDKAYQTAQQHGGAQITRKNPQQPVTFMLDYDPLKRNLIWYVNYPAGARSLLQVGLSATDGRLLQLEK